MNLGRKRFGKSTVTRNYRSPIEEVSKAIWLRASKGSGVYYQESSKTTAAGNSDHVGAWVDQSGNGNDGVQATDGQRPTMNTNILNGFPALGFNRANTEHFDTSLDLEITTGDFWMLAVSDPDDDDNAKRMFGNLANSGNYQGFYLEHDSLERVAFYIRQSSEDILSLLEPQQSRDSYNIFYVERDSGVARLYRNGSPVLADSSSQNLSGHGDLGIGIERTGGSASYGGRMAEVMGNAGTVLTDDQRRIVHKHLGGQLGITTQFDMPFYIPGPDSVTKVLDFDGNSGGHPAVVKVGSTYYMLTSGSDGGRMYTSSNGTTWSSQGAVVLNGTQSWAEAVISPHFTYIDGTYYAIFTGQDASGNRAIGVASNSGDPTDSDDWSWYASNPLISHDVFGETKIMDPQLMYFADGFNPGNGDGEHKFWLLFSKHADADKVQEVYLAYADSIEGTWTLANSGNAVIDRNHSSLGHWPGALAKVGDEIYYLYSSGHPGASPQTGWLAWAKTSDLITWTYPLLEPLTYDGGLVGYERLIEPCMLEVGNEIWVYVAASTDGVGSSTRDDVILIKMKKNTDSDITIL